MCGESTDIEETKDVVSRQEYMSLKAMVEANHEVGAALASTITHFTDLVLSR
jgi:hypothetical protein